MACLPFLPVAGLPLPIISIRLADTCNSRGSRARTATEETSGHGRGSSLPLPSSRGTSQDTMVRRDRSSGAVDSGFFTVFRLFLGVLYEEACREQRNRRFTWKIGSRRFWGCSVALELQRHLGKLGYRVRTRSVTFQDSDALRITVVLGTMGLPWALRILLGTVALFPELGYHLRGYGTVSRTAVLARGLSPLEAWCYLRN